MSHSDSTPVRFLDELSPVPFELMQKWANIELTTNTGPIVGALQRAWRKLPEELRNRLSAIFARIFDMCAPEALPYLHDMAEVVWAKDEAVSGQSKVWSIYDLAARLFLADRARFEKFRDKYVSDMQDCASESQDPIQQRKRLRGKPWPLVEYLPKPRIVPVTSRWNDIQCEGCKSLLAVSSGESIHIRRGSLDVAVDRLGVSVGCYKTLCRTTNRLRLGGMRM